MKNKEQVKVKNVVKDNDQTTLVNEWVNEVKKASQFERAWRVAEKIIDLIVHNF